MSNKNTIGVTAASGQLGSAIVRAAVEIVGDENVVGLARTPSKAESLGVEVRAGDYASRSELTESLRGVDSLLLVSGMDAPDKRIGLHRNVIEAAKAAGVSKIVYTSIQGAEQGTAFSPVVQSNRQTERDIRDSGLTWAIGRNGIYIEPDVEYIDTYKQRGEIANCAGDEKCGYTTRSELALAYARMLTKSKHDGQTYNLHGEALTQQQLAEYLNGVYGTDLKYRAMTVAEYREERIAELGEFLGTVIAGIYEGIRNGAANNESHYALAAGRTHQSWSDYFEQFKTTVVDEPTRQAAIKLPPEQRISGIPKAEPAPRKPKPDRMRLPPYCQSLLDSGVVQTRAELARYLGVSRARVTQVLRRFDEDDNRAKKTG